MDAINHKPLKIKQEKPDWSSMEYENIQGVGARPKTIISYLNTDMDVDSNFEVVKEEFPTQDGTSDESKKIFHTQVAIYN